MYLVFDNESEFNKWHERVNKHLGYPNAETKTERYTRPIMNEKNDKVICMVGIEDLPTELLENRTPITKDEAIKQDLIKVDIEVD